MPVIRLNEVACDVVVSRGHLPLCFGGQAATRPASIRVRLVVADVTDRRIEIQVALATQRELALKVVTPVQRARPAPLIDRCPAIR